MKAGARVEANAAEMCWCPRAGAKPNSHNSVITATGLEQRTMLESWGRERLRVSHYHRLQWGTISCE